MNGIMIDGDAALVLTFLFVVAGVCTATVLVLEVIKAAGEMDGHPAALAGFVQRGRADLQSAVMSALRPGDGGSAMSDPIIAETVLLANCPPDCPCQSVSVEFYDTDHTCFAAIPLSPEDARKMAADLLASADQAEARKAQLEGRVI
ncbi:hypothetical protein SAMN05444007_108234 [Cribrihabitans marinus]|uniref:Uncharacterized protein n=1 Tax=Cribrihabitans marinus TaxID=1227549 RepID=A0A1H7CZK0_9RHOB|nr:hypothetical protein [Cribrihabitans marinus]GGH36191.1 hypothetical protein GCM10010973_30020 [Cribrihabitans marinus]SEJ91295.1 hypothetical protein SAMN05444007_108234 [Cribrihabitans marinus]